MSPRPLAIWGSIVSLQKRRSLVDDVGAARTATASTPPKDCGGCRGEIAVFRMRGQFRLWAFDRDECMARRL